MKHKKGRASTRNQGEQETIRRLVSWGYSDRRLKSCLLDTDRACVPSPYLDTSKNKSAELADIRMVSLEEKTGDLSLDIYSQNNGVLNLN